MLSERDHDRQPSTAIFNEATLATIDRWVAYRVWHSHVPGAQVAIGLGNELVFSAAYGYADLEQRTPMRTDHLFRVASHSKTFTATLRRHCAPGSAGTHQRCAALRRGR